MNDYSFIFVPAMRARDENKIEAIRKKAIALIVKKGLDGFSMQKLAKAAGISPATIYIYYKDKDDLITQLGIEETKRMVDSTLENFNPSMSFAKGLELQWRNRMDYWLKNPLEAQFLEQLKHSPYHTKMSPMVRRDFSNTMRLFVEGAIKRKELMKLPVEVYWSVAFSPLYNLIKFHLAGRSMINDTFVLTDELFTKTLSLVLKALKP